MKKTTKNFIIDAIGFVGFVFLTATGILVRYILPPGSGHHTTIWGLDRHEWGGIHFWIAFGFLSVLVIHLLLHWRWILCVLRGQPREGSGMRLALGLVGVLAIIAVSIAPFGSSVERATNTSPKNEQSTSNHDTESIRGRMTLSEIEQMAGVPVGYLIEHLDVPRDVQLDVGVAKLGKQYGFDIDDVREAVRSYKAAK